MSKPKCPLHYSENPRTQAELGLSAPSIRRLTRRGEFGAIRYPTRAEVERWNISPQAHILNGHRVERAAQRRTKATIDARIAKARRG